MDTIVSSRRRTISTAALISGVSLLGLMAAPAAAQTSTSQGTSGGSDSGVAASGSPGAVGVGSGLEEIVVTAQRTSQSLQDVPIAISAFTSETLQRQQINNSSDLQLTLPNITFTKSNFTTGVFTIRGVGDLCVGVTCDSATAIHVNDLPLFNTRIFETDYFDLQRVEVLRGPQGTLFGRNATAGVVNFITAKPDLHALHAAVEGEYGNYNEYKIKAMINVPLTDTLGIRVAGTYLNRGGFTENLYNNSRIDSRDEYAARASLRWQPTPSTTVDLMGYYFHEKDSRLRNQKQLCERDPTGVLGCLPGGLANQATNANSTLASLFVSQQFLGSSAIFGALAPALRPLAIANLYGPDSYAGSAVPSDPRKVYTAYRPNYFADEINATVKVEHDFGKFKLAASALYQRNSVDSSQDYNLTLNNAGPAIGGLTVASLYGAGQAGAISPALAPLALPLSQIKPGITALTPNGPGGPYCTSSVSDTTGTGLFGGHGVCAAVPLNFDRSVQRDDGYTGEVILSSQLDGKFNFLVGGIYNRFRTTENSYYVNAFGLDYGSAVLGLANTLGRQFAGQTTFPSSFEASPYYRNNTNYYRLDSYGLFGEAYFKANDRLKATIGLRYNNDKKIVSARTTLFTDNNGFVAPVTLATNNSAVLVPYGAANITNAAGYANLDFDPTLAGPQEYQIQRVSFSEFTGRVVIDYKITDENLLYASYSRGYKSGGINPPLSPVFTVSNTFTPEFIDSFEVGSKNTFLGGTLRLNVSGFYYKYKGLQVSRIVARTSVNDNVNANIYGVEADAIIQPIPALAVNLGFSYLKTSIAGDTFFVNPRDPSGGRSDAVIIKDITNASNCVLVPTTPGNAAGANGYVAAINGSPTLGLNAPTPFPAGSGINGATGAFGICSALRGNAATVGALFGGVQVLSEGVAANVRGNSLPQSPNYKASAGIQYTIGAGHDISVVPRFDIALTGNSTGSIFNDYADRIPAYYIMNAQLQVNGKDDRWFLRGFVQNLANNSAITGLYVTDQSSGLFTNIFTLEPRRYGIAAGVKF